ncbi:TCR/Tet family MFS transporter [Bradyrhizobium sp. UFLA05-109]
MSGKAGETISSDAAPIRRGAVAFIFVTILLDMLALGVIMPILPKLIESFVGNDTAHAARIFGLFGTAWALMQFVFSPVLGALSDRFGRRPVVLLSNFGLAADYVLMALAPSLIWLFIGRIISGITSASISTAFAYIADLTPPERRAAVFGRIGAAFGAGFIFGPALGGLLGDIDPRLPFWAAAVLSFANAIYGLLILPESLAPDRRSPFRWRRANPLGALHLLRSNAVLAGLSVVNFIAQVAHVVLPSTFVLYATYRYGWDSKTVGLTLAMVGICAMVVQGLGVGPIVRALGERNALLLGLSCGAIGFLIFGSAPTGPLFWLGIPVMSLSGVSGAAAQSLMTRLVAPDQQGQLQGATTSVQSVSQLVGPFLFTLTFSYFISGSAFWHLPGAPFLLAAVLMVMAVMIAMRTLAGAKSQEGRISEA